MTNSKGQSARWCVVGFDSAWTDKPGAPGAVSVIHVDSGVPTFVEPELATFDQALHLIHAERDQNDLCLVALDQPTIVPNLVSMRPVDRVAASLISWLGGRVQPANRSKVGMFDDAAPIWRFKERLDALERPEDARTADKGFFLIEVFPALALPSIDERFNGRLKAPRYNPARKKTCRSADWFAVLEGVAKFARELGLDDVAAWCEGQRFHAPRKADQDKLDSIICALVGYVWLASPRGSSIMIGDVDTGYMIAPATSPVRSYLTRACNHYGVSIV